MVVADHSAIVDRLAFSLPPFVRLQWASDGSRERWQSQIDAAREAYRRIEILSVARGVRRAARRTVSPMGFKALEKEVAPIGLTVRPIVNVVPNRGGYRARMEHAKPNEPYDISCVIAPEDDGMAFVEVSRAHDDDAVGKLLGIPACCRAFFRDVWHRKRMVDTTWPMASTFSRTSSELIIGRAEPEANVLLRWLGVRLVPHLPCSFTCRETIRFARVFAEVGFHAGYGAGIVGAWQMLSWPMEWSALHGIAEIRTPVFKIAVDTDATGRRYTVQLAGNAYPEDAQRGLRFPYVNDGGAASATKRPQHSLNGFKTAAAMLSAHLELLNILDPIVDGINGTIVDLGCGTGELLRSLVAGKKNVVPHGIDLDERKIALAKEKLGPAARLYVGDYLDKNGPWLHDKHALIVGTLALCESNERRDVCLRLLSQSSITALYYYEGYKGNVASCALQLQSLVNSLPGYSVMRGGERCWVVRATSVSAS